MIARELADELLVSAEHQGRAVAFYVARAVSAEGQAEFCEARKNAYHHARAAARTAFMARPELREAPVGTPAPAREVEVPTCVIPGARGFRVWLTWSARRGCLVVNVSQDGRVQSVEVHLGRLLYELGISRGDAEASYEHHGRANGVAWRWTYGARRPR